MGPQFNPIAYTGGSIVRQPSASAFSGRCWIGALIARGDKHGIACGERVILSGVGNIMHANFLVSLTAQ